MDIWKSHPFTVSPGYLMCVRVKPDAMKIVVDLLLLKGDDDEHLKWPMEIKKEISLVLHYQQSKQSSQFISAGRLLNQCGGPPPFGQQQQQFYGGPFSQQQQQFFSQFGGGPQQQLSGRILSQQQPSGMLGAASQGSNLSLDPDHLNTVYRSESEEGTVLASKEYHTNDVLMYITVQCVCRKVYAN